MASKHSPALNLASAAVAGAVTLVRPARFPRWARRGLSLANTAGTVGSVFLAVRGEDNLPADHPLHRALAVSDLAAATTGGLMLVTSGLGVKADAKVERFLVKHGVRRPRLVMAAGVVVVLFAAKTVQDAAGRKGSDKHDAGAAAAGPEATAAGSTVNPALPSATAPEGPAVVAHEEDAPQPERDL